VPLYAPGTAQVRWVWLEYVVIFALGSAVGSFLNVVIHRVPRGESIVRPGSHCPKCGRPIRPFENIPLLSYVCLRGRCSGCGEPISWRYPAVEAGMGVLAAVLLWRFGWGVELLIYGVLAALLLALSVIDIITYRLPNRITVSGAVLALLLTLLFRRDHLLMMAAGGLVGLGLLGFMGLVGRLLFHKETLGMGDVKLAGMIGLFLGPLRTVGMFIVGIFIGALIGGALVLAGGRGWGQRIPFGPYLAAGAMISILWGEKLWRWYLSLVIP